MSKLVTLQFTFEEDELEEFPSPLYDWVFGEICQNLGFGFLITCKVEDEAGAAIGLEATHDAS